MPARLTAEEAAWVIGCEEGDISALIRNKLLIPLKNHPGGGRRPYFAFAELHRLGQRRSWLNKVSACLGSPRQRESIKKRPAERQKFEAEMEEICGSGKILMFTNDASSENVTPGEM